MNINLKPIGYVKNVRITPIDDQWESIRSEIVLAEEIPTESLDHIEDFSQPQKPIRQPDRVADLMKNYW